MTNVKRTEGRPARKPVSQRRVLTAPQREGYHRRFVNDIPGRVGLFKEGGWTPVIEDGIDTADSSRMAESPMGSLYMRHVGNNVNAILMEIPDEFYNEDQAAKIEKLKMDEKAILSAKAAEGQYGEIVVKRE